MLPTDSSSIKPSVKPSAKLMRAPPHAALSRRWLPVALCLCAELRASPRTRVVVMMHRREAATSSNTGRIAARVLEGARAYMRGGDPAIAVDPLPSGRRPVLFAAEARSHARTTPRGRRCRAPRPRWHMLRASPPRRDDIFQRALSW
jgi:DTW domain-containing protein YfiP